MKSVARIVQLFCVLPLFRRLPDNKIPNYMSKRAPCTVATEVKVKVKCTLVQALKHLGYKNQSVYAISGTSRCLLSDKYKTLKYSVGRA